MVRRYLQEYLFAVDGFEALAGAEAVGEGVGVDFYVGVTLVWRGVMVGWGV